jgi:hypothetical protein
MAGAVADRVEEATRSRCWQIEDPSKYRRLSCRYLQLDGAGEIPQCQEFRRSLDIQRQDHQNKQIV